MKGESSTLVYVDPPTVSLESDETFTVQVKVTNVKNLYTYEFKLGWDPSLLEVTGIAEGPFLNSEGTHVTYFQDKIYNTPDSLGVSGYSYVACSLLGELATAAASGNGTLATVEFRANELGNTSLHLYATKLIDSLMVEISHETEDGYSIIIPEFPSFLFLPLFTITLLLAVIVLDLVNTTFSPCKHTSTVSLVVKNSMLIAQ